MKNFTSKKTNIVIILLIALSITATSNAQNTFPNNGSVGVGTNSPNSSSILEVKSTTKGFLPPRMTRTQRDAIASPAQGLLIYQTDNTKGLYQYDGTSWKIVNQVRGLNDNIFIGQTAGDANTTGKSNIGLGSGALKSNTVSSGLIAVGDSALNKNTSGQNNLAFGHKALMQNITGTNNTATGTGSLMMNTIGG
jgi:trimeric autotransporter adhesin